MPGLCLWGVLTVADLQDLFAAMRQDIDSEPFAHEGEPLVAAVVPATPGQGVGCLLVLAAFAPVLAAVYLVAHLIAAVAR